MGHADLVYIRKAHGEPHVRHVPVLVYGIDLISEITGRLLHAEEHPVRKRLFSHVSSYDRFCRTYASAGSLRM